jgi:cell pole-organizing protein PopZ
VAEAPAVESQESAEIESVEDTSYGKFEQGEKPKAPAAVPYPRFSKVVAERNDLRGQMSAAEKALARVEGQLAEYKHLDDVVAEKYLAKPELLKFDATFMETFDKLASADPTLKAAAAKVKAAMGTTMTVEQTPATPAQEEAAPAENSAVTRLLEREVKNVMKEALAPHIKGHFVEAVTRDVLANVGLDDLADITAEQAVELAKVYFEQTGTPPVEYMVVSEKAGSPKPAVKGSAAPARVSGAPTKTEAETPKFKTREEFDKARAGRFAAVTAELFGEE